MNDKGSILKHNRHILHSRVLGEVVLCVIDPFNQILGWCGYKGKQQLQATVFP